MKTRRNILGGSAAASAGVLLAACGVGRLGEAGDTAGAGPAGNPATPTTITVWHSWDGSREPFVKQIIQRLTQQYPNLRVDASIVQTFRPENQEKLITAAAGGTPPDVVMLFADYIPEFGPQRNVLQPLDPWVKRDKLNLRETFYDADINFCQLDGKTWELPHTLPVTQVMILYNKDLTQRVGLDFEKSPPQTWDELLQAATKLNVRDGTTITQLGVDLHPTTGLFDVYAGTVKAAAFSPDGKKVTFNEPKALEATEWLVRARQAMGGLAMTAAFAQQNPGTSSDIFAKGKLALWHTHYGFPAYLNDNPTMKIGVVAVKPQQRGAEMALPHRNAWAWGMTAGSKAKDAAWLVTRKFTADEDGGGWLQVQLGRPSPIRKVNEGGEFKKLNPFWQEVTKTVAARWKRPASFIAPEANRAWGEVMTRIDKEEVSPRTGLLDGAAQVQVLLDQFWKARG